jgi:hypothetical protein
MWSKDKSVILSLVCTWTVAGLAVALAIALPFLCASGFFLGRALIAPESTVWLMPIYYAFCLPAAYALFALSGLLLAIKREQVFTEQNVRYLRRISWCCFTAALVLLASCLVSIVFFVLAILAAFFGVILRAVKNLFAAAVALQKESDLTI